MEISEQSSWQLVAHSARGLVMDMVATAKSGHLGTPLGLAELGAALWGKLLHYHPREPRWMGRDRLVLSAGHASAWLYAWLHLAGYELSIDELRSFRQKGSRTPGHPEFGRTPGVECSTGPLGQGIGNAVGMAVSAKMLAARFDTASSGLFDYRVICVCGDGCLQEGLSSEACSLAGLWHLNNFILLYDANQVTLDGPLALSQNEDVVRRFEAYGFDVQEIDGHDLTAIVRAYAQAARSAERPQLIIAHTVIGRGIVAIEGSSKAHGESGALYARELREKLGLGPEPFSVAPEIREFLRQQQGQQLTYYRDWQERFGDWKRKFPGKAEELRSLSAGEDFDLAEGAIPATTSPEATRSSSGRILQVLAERNSSLVTGSADLFSSCRNYLASAGDFSSSDFGGRNLFFGVREQAMGSILNGIAYDGFFRPSGSTFLVFSDYLRPVIRLAALAHLAIVYVLTHDSVLVGADGPTHQPVEQLAALRCIPNLDVIRPADAEEVLGAWQAALERREGPTALVLSRQELPPLEGLPAALRRQGVKRGAYIAREETLPLRKILLATGSELAQALEVGAKYPDTRVVSMPCMERFERLSPEEKEAVLPASCRRRVAMEAGSAQPWYRYVGAEGRVLSVEDFGFSAPAEELREHFGLTTLRLEAILQEL
ncbi:MAG: transketolase [Puniceicoccales bacterium]|jgi:transketolase|nr:transketolase [Puniceicoccales bacterium]